MVQSVDFGSHILPSIWYGTEGDDGGDYFFLCKDDNDDEYDDHTEFEAFLRIDI